MALPKRERFSTFFYGDYEIGPDGTDTHGREPKCYVANNGVSHNIADIQLLHAWDLFDLSEETIVLDKEPIDIKEEIILLLYWELLGKRYTSRNQEKNSDRHTEVPSNKRQHVEVQSLLYFTNISGISVEEYSFLWSYFGVYSELLENLLDELDKKESAIADFYQKYNVKRNQVLMSYFGEDQISQLERVSIIFGDFVKKPRALEILGSLLFLSKNVMPGYGFKHVNAELMRRKPEFADVELNKEAWEYLEVLGLVYPSAILGQLIRLKPKKKRN